MPEIIHIPRRFVKMPDPREQAVLPSEDDGGVAEGPLYLPQLAPGVLSPIRIEIDREQAAQVLNDRTCTGCGEDRDLHYQPGADRGWIGCEGAIQRALLLTQIGAAPVGQAEPWTVVGALQGALQTSCGTAMYEFCRSVSPDELLAICRTLAAVARRARQKAEGR